MHSRVVLLVLAAMLMAATVRAEGRAVPASKQFETEHVAEDWRVKYLGLSSRVDENSCGSPDQVAPIGDDGDQRNGGDRGLL